MARDRPRRFDRGRLRSALAEAGDAPAVLESAVPLPPELIERVRRALTAAAGEAVRIEARVNPRRPGTRLHIGRRTSVALDPGRRLLDELERDFAARAEGGIEGLGEAARILSALIREHAPEPGLEIEDVSGVGVVRQVGDGVALVEGLEDVGAQEVVRFEAGIEGVAFSLLDGAVGCLLLGPEAPIAEGSAVTRTGRLLHVPVGDGLVGRVVDALGAPIDGKGPIAADRWRPIERPAPGIVDRRPVCESLHTGIKVLDALVPLGRGQRELLLGDRQIGKTTIAVDVILGQRGADVTCVYASIGQKASSLARVVDLLEERGAMDYTIVVAAFASDPPAFRHVAPYAACTMAEEFMAKGRHALVVYDDLSKHAVTYREISALLKRPIGREAYPGDVFFVHSRLLERAARLRDELGGGSLTAIPIVETQAGDVSAFIPTNVISICDGQIVLDARLFNEGSRPAMDAGLSVSRVGGMAQTGAMRKVAGRLRIDLAQYAEMARFVKFGAEVDAATMQQLARGERELELLKQDAHAPLPLEKEVVTLYAAVHGYVDAIPLDRVRAFEAGLHAFVERERPEVLEGIRATRELTPDLEARLRDAIAAFVADFGEGPRMRGAPGAGP